MTRTIKIMIGVSAFAALSVAGIFPGAGQGHAASAAGKQAVRQTQDSPGQLVPRYAEALATGRIETWAKLDLGCLARQRRSTKGESAGMAESEAKACWDETMKAHVAMVADEPEAGIFGAVGRGLGFGLISETHRQADTWKDYPPGVFLSPAVTTDTVPHVTVKKVWPMGPIAIQEKGKDPVAVRGTMVELRVTYPDPLTAPLALKPGEVWWASGAIRRYGPVRELAVRVVVVSGLRKLGYSSDTAVMNEALADAPQIPATRYGLNPEIGRAFSRPGTPSDEPLIKGGLVLGSARWWTKQEATERFSASVERVKHLPSQGERLALLRQLLLLDPNDTETNAMLGAELFQTLLGEGLSKGGINAQDAEVRLRLAELYWNLQAPTWRQELVDVAVGHSTAAEALYGAIQALELAQRGRTENQELRRRLGALYRWNNDGDAALSAHEELFAQVPATNLRLRGALLSEVAWDRIHSEVPAQNILRVWEFDDQRPGEVPKDFSMSTGSEATMGTWLVEANPESPTAPHVLAQTSACPTPGCFHLLVAEGIHFEYPDMTVQLRQTSGGEEGGADIALAVQDSRNFYAVTFNVSTSTVAIHRVVNGQATLLGGVPVKY